MQPPAFTMFEESLADSLLEQDEELADLVSEELGRVNELELRAAYASLESMAEVNLALESACMGKDGGYISATIPAAIRWDLERTRPGFWRDAQCREDFLKRYPQCRVRYKPKPMVSMGGLFIASKYQPVTAA